MTLHADSTCPEIGKMQKPDQREIVITNGSFSQALSFLTSAFAFRFRSDPASNDAWLTIDFTDAEFEEAVARYIFRMLGKRYTPLSSAPVRRHC